MSVFPPPNMETKGEVVYFENLRSSSNKPFEVRIWRKRGKLGLYLRDVRGQSTSFVGEFTDMDRAMEKIPSLGDWLSKEFQPKL